MAAVELAKQAGVSKGYLSEIESGGAPRPSADILFRIAAALGTSIGDLLEKEVVPSSTDIPDSLKRFAEATDLPQGDVQMLAQIKFRGEQPRTEEDWRYLYESIKRSIISGS